MPNKSIQKTNINWIIFSLLGISIFNLLPVLVPSTADFAYMFVFIITVFFIGKGIVSNGRFPNHLQTTFIYISLLVWTVIMFLRINDLNYDLFRSFFVSPYVFLPYLLPFYIGCFSPLDFPKILPLIQYFNIAFLLLLGFYFIQPAQDITTALGFVEDLNKYFVFPAFFMLLSFKYLNSRQKILSLVVFFIGFVIAIYTARRSLTWTFAWALIFFIYMLYDYNKVNIIKKFRFFIVMILAGMLAYFSYQKYEEVLFGNLIEKIDADTRGSVLTDFERDMKLEDWIFGKGIDGTYFIDNSSGYFPTNYRNIIEAGYLNLILKGGYIYILLLLLIYGSAIYRGFLVSNNSLSRGLSLFIVLHMLELYPAGVLTFNLRFLLIWFCIAVLWNNKFLQMTDQELLSGFKHRIK